VVAFRVSVNIKRRLAAAGGSTMTSPRYPFAMDNAARKWRALAERRQAHFVDLYKTGRWKHYYSETEFLIAMRQAIGVAERWAELAPRAEDFKQAAE